MAARLDDVVTELHDRLPDLADEPVEVWPQERPRVLDLVPADDGVSAVTNGSTRRIHASDGAPDLETALAHEAIPDLLT